MKTIDIYGVKPTLVVEGEHSFKTWWGTFFTLCTVLCICYYAYQKSIFYFINRSNYYVQKYAVLDEHEWEEGLQIHTLKEQGVEVQLEFGIDP